MAAVLEKFHSLPAALAPALPDDALHPLRYHRIREGLVAAYSPAQLARADAWDILVGLFGSLVDVTPASAVTA